MSTNSKSTNGSAKGAVFPPEPCSRKNRFMPMDYEITTVISAHGNTGGKKRSHHMDTSQRHNHRQRYPEVEAIVQIFFRLCAFILNLSVLIIVRILDTDLETVMAVRKMYGVVAYSLFINMLEFLSLSNPQPTLLIYLFPWLFPARASTSSPELLPRFPRLPSLYLAICELAATVASYWSAILFLNPVVENDGNRENCPVETCVTQWERDMIYGYILEVVVGLIHIGFFLMAVVHYAKRKGPGWLEAWEK